MCLAVPGEVLDLLPNESSLPMARVSFGGVVKEICVACVPEAQIGDYLLVHAGFAISRLDEKAAGQVFAAFASLDQTAGEEGT